MKNKFQLIAIFFLLAGCKNEVDISKEIPGAYSLTEQDIQHGETLNTLKDLKQMKFYTGTHFMYTQINPQDSVSAFGVGTYDTREDTLSEHVLYSSSGATFNDQPISYNLGIKITPEGYTQKINGIVINGDTSTLTELYSRVKEKDTARLDGVWKEQKSYLVNGKDTTVYQRTQFKSFFDGYFMFGSTSKDSVGKTVTNMGYGTFKMVSDKQFSETDLNSSLPFVAGNTFTIDYVFTDNDHYYQSITNPDGSISFEFYEKLK